MTSLDGPVARCPKHGEYSLHTGCFGCERIKPMRYIVRFRWPNDRMNLSKAIHCQGYYDFGEALEHWKSLLDGKNILDYLSLEVEFDDKPT